MRFMKGKNIAERAEDEAAKVKFLRMKLEGKKAEGHIKGMEEKQRSAELRRLQA